MKQDFVTEISRANLDYSEDLYLQYLKDPSLVQDSWRWFFQGLRSGMSSQNQTSFASIQKEINVFRLCQYYRYHGNLKAQLDPLQLDSQNSFLSLQDFHITDQDLNTNFASSRQLFKTQQNLKQVIKFLDKTYCGPLSLQIGNCKPHIKQWFFKEFEQESYTLNHEYKKQAFDELAQATTLEEFLHFRFLGKKRFSLEGLDVLIPMLNFLLKRGVDLHVKNLNIGMSHRGRINVLINVLKQNPKVLFSKFDESVQSTYLDQENPAQDVKYHLGFSSKKQIKDKTCFIYLGYNPSHLEAINPVICGISRAIQRQNQDTTHRRSVVPLLIHGDSAICGQGSVSETLQLSKLKGYTVGGAIHIILNNQLGFTTSVQESRSSHFASDCSQTIQAPSLLVNADHPDSCLRAIDIALRFRHEFSQDIFIDLIGYRRHGHNEGDEPSFTQPLMYKKIKTHPRVLTRYQNQLIKEQVLHEKTATDIIKNYQSYWEKHLAELKQKNTKTKQASKNYSNCITTNLRISNLKHSYTTPAILNQVCKVISCEPENFTLNPKIKKILSKRREAIQKNELDWSICELAAYGSLIAQGFSVRLTGQDSKRGTFSHRHAIYYDYKTSASLSPLKQLALKHKREFCLYNSPLSEMAVMAFEYGNSCLAPDFLTLWEAQFGDFVNGAQILIDQFLSSGEFKWHQTTDIVLLLPHGYEGQGPEHSSAYLERFLQLCSQNNMIVCNFTKSSQIFHALRRQKMLLSQRKPLIIMTPKSLLRHPGMLSTQQDLLQGSFEKLLWDKDIKDTRDIKTLILCSGKVYFDLKQELNKEKYANKRAQCAVFRLEQLYPFPQEELNPVLNGFPCATQILWLQEEPQNRGAWFFVKTRLEQLIKNLGQKFEIHYKGRQDMAAAAEGSELAHREEQNKIITNCISAI